MNKSTHNCGKYQNDSAFIQQISAQSRRAGLTVSAPIRHGRIGWSREVKNMSICSCKCNCTTAAIVASLIIGIIAAFLQITAVITVTPVFLWVALGIAVGFLGILILTSGYSCCTRGSECRCAALDALLIAILGTVLFAVILLAVGIEATSVVSAVLVGILLFFLALTLTEAACYVRQITGCAQ